MRTWTITIAAENEEAAIKAIKTDIPVSYMHGGFADDTTLVIVERK